MSNLLLVWEEIPYRSKIFLVPTDHEMAASIRASAGCYINLDDLPIEHPVFLVNDWIDSGGADQFKINKRKIVNLKTNDVSEFVIAGLLL
jgi:hypothetical protein